MNDILALALGNLLTPMVLCFALGALAAAVRSDLEIPSAVAKFLAIYLMFAIGFKGGVAMAGERLGPAAAALGVGIVLSALLPLLAFALLQSFVRLGRVDAAATAAHYGSVSVVTFVTATQFLAARDVPYEGYLVAVMAAMESPAIITGLLLARAGSGANPHLWRETLTNGAVILLLGGFAIGWATGAPGLAAVKPFTTDIFNGLLCIFLLDMGLVAVRQLRAARSVSWRLIVFALGMPWLGAVAGLGGAWILGLSVGGAALLATLCASASYIAVPAAMRLALPKSDPSIALTASLAATFPMNVLIGIPAYYALSALLFG